MIEFARLTLLVAVLAFSVQANERAKVVVKEIKAAKEAKAARVHREDSVLRTRIIFIKFASKAVLKPACRERRSFINLDGRFSVLRKADLSSVLYYISQHHLSSK